MVKSDHVTQGPYNFIGSGNDDYPSVGHKYMIVSVPSLRDAEPNVLKGLHRGHLERSISVWAW